MQVRLRENSLTAKGSVVNVAPSVPSEPDFKLQRTRVLSAFLGTVSAALVSARHASGTRGKLIGSVSECIRPAWASQVAEWERIHLPVQETPEMQVGSLGQEDPLE